MKWIEEIGGGLNFRGPKFIRLFDKIAAEEVKTLIVALKDRLARFGFDFLKRLCQNKNCELIVKSTHDAGVGLAIAQLEYKAEKVGGKLQKVGRFFPSSKRCHACRYINEDLGLGDREWKCPNCGAEHDRDLNGAINVEMEA